MALAAILIAAPDIYGLTASAVPPITFFGGISVLIAFSAIGVFRRWRWLFWLIVVAFLAGAIRIVASALELAGVAPLDGPRWYAALQGAIGIAQLAIGIAMVPKLSARGDLGPRQRTVIVQKAPASSSHVAPSITPRTLSR